MMKTRYILRRLVCLSLCFVLIIHESFGYDTYQTVPFHEPSLEIRNSLYPRAGAIDESSSTLTTAQPVTPDRNEGTRSSAVSFAGHEPQTESQITSGPTPISAERLLKAKEAAQQALHVIRLQRAGHIRMPIQPPLHGMQRSWKWKQAMEDRNQKISSSYYDQSGGEKPLHGPPSALPQSSGIPISKLSSNAAPFIPKPQRPPGSTEKHKRSLDILNPSLRSQATRSDARPIGKSILLGPQIHKEDYPILIKRSPTKGRSESQSVKKPSRPVKRTLFKSDSTSALSPLRSTSRQASALHLQAAPHLPSLELGTSSSENTNSGQVTHSLVLERIPSHANARQRAIHSAPAGGNVAEAGRGLTERSQGRNRLVTTDPSRLGTPNNSAFEKTSLLHPPPPSKGNQRTPPLYGSSTGKRSGRPRTPATSGWAGSLDPTALHDSLLSNIRSPMAVSALSGTALASPGGPGSIQGISPSTSGSLSGSSHASN